MRGTVVLAPGEGEESEMARSVGMERLQEMGEGRLRLVPGEEEKK